MIAFVFEFITPESFFLHRVIAIHILMNIVKVPLPLSDCYFVFPFVLPDFPRHIMSTLRAE